MFSAILPGADIRRTERCASALLRTPGESSEHAEGVFFHPHDSRVRHGRCGRTGCPLGQRLKFTIGTEGELLSDRGGEKALALAPRGDRVAPPAKIIPHPPAGKGPDPPSAI